jgi:lipoprotein signal peptidase
MSERTYRWLFCLLAVCGLALDQGGKYGVFYWLSRHGQELPAPPGRENERTYQQDLVPGVFRLLTEFRGPATAGDHWLLSRLRTVSSDRMPHVNQGALWGVGNEHKELANNLFAIVSVLAAAAIIFWCTRRSMARDWTLCAALGLILAGTLGNLYDRLIFNGVRDFLCFYWFEFPVFNFADCCLVCGASLLLAQAFWSHAPVEERPRTEMALAPAGEAEVKSA